MQLLRFLIPWAALLVFFEGRRVGVYSDSGGSRHEGKCRCAQLDHWPIDVSKGPSPVHFVYASWAIVNIYASLVPISSWSEDSGMT